jgi:thiol:disulfide interchange protein DsbD
MLRVLVGIFLGLFIFLAHAENKSQPLPPNQAFKLSVEYSQPGLMILRWQIARNYYLYRDKINISSALDSQVKLGTLVLPNGTPRQDSLHGNYQAYSGQLIVPVPLLDEKSGQLNLEVAYQGCAEDGFCYPPITKLLKINLSHVTPPKDLTSDLVVKPRVGHKAVPASEQAEIEGIFDDRSVLFIILSFLGLGLLLAFTPCVLPMIPILSGIIVGHGKHLGMRKTFLLSLAYVLGMAITYAIAGMLVAIVGSSIQTQLQRPWVIVMFSVIFVMLALSLFGLYELQMPNSWQRRITAWSNRQKGGSYFSVFIMGGISSLIVSPCVTPPLIGVLSFIANSGNVWLGGFALLSLGFGMGVPLLLVGLSAGHILPKAGAWMGAIEKIMGVTMLAFAVWILSRIIPGYVTLFLWAALLIMSAVFLGVFSPAMNDFKRLCRGLGLVLLIYGIILMMGAALGNSDILHPLQNWKVSSPGPRKVVKENNTTFVVLKNMDELDAILAAAAAKRKIVLLDFYADWCEYCVRMDKEVFNQQTVKNILTDMMVLRADVTKNDDFSQALLKRYNVIAPPTIIFFNRDGIEIADRLVGGMSAEKLIAEIRKIQE